MVQHPKWPTWHSRSRTSGRAGQMDRALPLPVSSEGVRGNNDLVRTMRGIVSAIFSAFTAVLARGEGVTTPLTQTLTPSLTLTHLRLCPFLTYSTARRNHQ